MRQVYYVSAVIFSMFVAIIIGLFMENRDQKITPFPFSLKTPFSLQKTDDKELTLQSFKDNWSLVYFGYTHCPDVCSISNSLMTKFLDSHKNNTVKYPLQGIFVSVDPKRDTMNHLKQYVNWYSSSLLGATGNDVELKKATYSFLTSYLIKEEDKNKKEYEVFHPMSVYLVSPNQMVVGRVVEPKNIKDLEGAFLPLMRN